MKIPPDLKKASIHIGGVFASREPAVVRTVLGSCIAACLFDATAQIGGMNHFMLPSSADDESVPTRFGIHAMEVLINQVMQLGGDRRRFQAKVFGGADVLRLRGSHLRVAEKNRTFVHEFLEAERIPILAHRLGGIDPLQVYFFTHSAKAMVKPLRRESAERILDQENSYQHQISQEVATRQVGDVTLF